MPDVSVVVPVYQSEKTIAELCERILKTFDDNIHMTVEVILVNDGSTDMSGRQPFYRQFAKLMQPTALLLMI